MKKVIATLMVVLVLLAAFAACSKKAEEEPVSVEWWSLWEPGMADQMIADFEAVNPNIKIVRTQHGDPEIWDAMVVAIATRSGPDIFFNWTGPYQESFYRKGGAISLNDYSKQYGWSDKLYPAAVEPCTYDGNLTLIPYSFSVMGIVYKKSTFEQFGIKVPTTYGELSAACDTFVKNGVLPYSIGGIDAWHTMRWADALLEQYCGPEMHDKLNDINDTSVSWNCPEVIAAFTELSTWISRGWVDPNFAGVAEAESYTPIFNGQAAMNVNGDWAEFNIRNAELNSADFGIFPFPRDGGKGRLGRVVSGVGLCDFNGKKATDAAAKFVDFLLKPESVNKYIPMTGDLSGVKGVPVDPSAAILQQSVKLMDECDMYPPTDGILPEETVDVYLRLCTEIILGTTSPEAAAQRMADSIDSVRAKK